MTDERLKAWKDFLERWPLENLAEMRLSDYTNAGGGDSFTYWLEAKTDALGSIWGGSAFKFGIFSRKSTEQKTSDGERSYSDDYGWYSKYGKSPEEAFEKVRGIVSTVAQAARDGNLEEIEKADLGPAIKWKIAFIYQDRSKPSVVAIYKAAWLRKWLNSNEQSIALLQTQAVSKKPAIEDPSKSGAELLDFSQAIWKEVDEELKSEFKVGSALETIREHGAYESISEPTNKVAGFRTENGQQLALLLESARDVIIFLEPGGWRKAVEGLVEVTPYHPEAPRNSNLAANAPRLSQGHPAMKVTVPSPDILANLLDAYAEVDTSEKESRQTRGDRPAYPKPPLNQIFFGPPGTGKTYHTVDAALDILDPIFLEQNRSDRTALKRRYDELSENGQIRFVTFHQSFAYEDFVEGLRAEVNEAGQLRHTVADGVFKIICSAAAAKTTVKANVSPDIADHSVWKMSLGTAAGADSYIFNECIENQTILHGYGSLADFSKCNDRKQIADLLAARGRSVAQDSYEVSAINTFVNKMKVGDLVIVSEGNLKFRAIGQITGDYRVVDRGDDGDEYGQCRSVNWLRVYSPSLPFDQLLNNQFSQMTLYELREPVLDRKRLKALLNSDSDPLPDTLPFLQGQTVGNGYEIIRMTPDVVELRKPNGKLLPLPTSILKTLAQYVTEGKITVTDIKARDVFKKVPESTLEPYLVNGYDNVLGALIEALPKSGGGKGKSKAPGINRKVLIIDEINRGNVSRIFGELISLIEPSKRIGADEALEVTLPYSKTKFSVPDNLFIIGTMNTADRSLSSMDVALRRRFTFREISPNPSLLDDVFIEQINIGALLRVMNSRIQHLLDRDHCLGHAYFMPLKAGEKQNLSELAAIFRLNVLPLLQEYFFEDWQRIQWVLNDHRKPEEYRFVKSGFLEPEALFGSSANIVPQGEVWELNDDAFDRSLAYRSIISVVE